MSRLGINRRWWELLITMTEKEIKARYKLTILGFLWMFLNPILQMLVIGFVFQFFMPVKVDNYFIFLFSGLLPWDYFSTTLLKNVPAIINERMLIQKSNFPREIIILSIVFSNLFHYLISTIIFVIFLAVSGYRANWLMIPLAVVWLAAITIGFSLLLSSLNVKFRDVNFVTQAIVPLWFYATPVAYTLNLIPNHISKYFYLNPMVAIIEFNRTVLINGTFSGLVNLIPSIVFTIAILLFGWWHFKKESYYFDDWI